MERQQELSLQMYKFMLIYDTQNNAKNQLHETLLLLFCGVAGRAKHPAHKVASKIIMKFCIFIHNSACSLDDSKSTNKRNKC
jgi:hypothetical protein